MKKVVKKPVWVLEKNLLVKDFVFKDFIQAIAFMNKVAKIAQKVNHHPNMLIHKYNHVRITLQSHDVMNVTKKDRNLAVLIDKLWEI